MDLIIPGEQYFYLKARNAVERQKWLVALGTAKACLTDSRTQKEKGKNFLFWHILFTFYFPILTLVDIHTKMSKNERKSVLELCVQPVLLVFGATKQQGIWEPYLEISGISSGISPGI